MAVGGSASGQADWGGGPSIQKGGPEGVFQLSGDHTPQPPWESLLQGTGEENLSDSRTSDSGGTMQFSSWPWNTGPALYPPQGAQGFMGICPTSEHVFYGLGEGIRPCPLWHSVGGAPGVQSRRPTAKGCTVPVRPEQESGSHCRQ